MKFKNYILIFVLFLGLIFAKESFAYSYVVSDPALCGTDAYSQTCVGGQVICGINTSNNVVSCALPSSLTPPATSNPVEGGTVTASGGYMVDCYAFDSGAPYCNNNGQFVCYQNSTCNSAGRQTICSFSNWTTKSSSCGNCKSTHTDCDATTAYDCRLRSTITNCASYDYCSQASTVCTACNAGYTLINNACYTSVKLDVDSVLSDRLRNSTSANPIFNIFSTGSVSIGSTTPSSTLSIFGGNVFVHDAVITSATPNAAITKNYLDSALSAYSSSNSMWQLSGNNLFASSTAWNVGIGTTTPASKLQVYGTTGRLAIFGEVGASTAIVNPVNVSFGSTYGNSTPGSVNNLKWDLFTSASSGSRYGIGMSSNLMEFQSGPSGGLGFFVNQGTEAMRILSTGNVGIGTTTPSAALDIFGKAKITSAGTIYNTDSTRYLDMTGVLSDSLKVSGNIYTTAGLFKSDAAGTNYMLGSLGVGTTTAGTNKLYVNGTSYLNGASTINGIATVNSGLELATGGTRSVSYYGPVGNGYFTRMEQTSTAGFGTYGTVTGDWALYNRFTGANTRGWVWQLGTTNIASLNGQGGLQIAGNFNSQGTGNNYFAGNVGIGTSNPGDKLVVYNGAFTKYTSTGIDGTTDSLLKFGYFNDLQPGGTGNTNRYQGIDATITAGAGSANKMLFKLFQGGANNVAPATVMTLQGDGNVGIGTTAPDAKLQVAGSFHVSGALNSVVLDRLTGTGNRIVMADASGSLYATSSSIATGLPVGTAGQTLRSDGTNWLANSVLYNNGTNVGIGITAPNKNLHVLGGLAVDSGTNTGIASLYLSHTGVNNQHKAAIFTTYTTGFGRSSSMQFAMNNIMDSSIVTTADAKMTILEGGNTGIGTTNPSSILDIRSATNARLTINRTGSWASSPSDIKFNTNDAGTDYWTLGMQANSTNNFYLNKNATNYLTILDSGGSIGVATTTPDAKLNINGTLHVSGALNTVTIDNFKTTGAGTVMADAAGTLYISQSNGVGRYRAATAATYNGNQGGYTAVNGYCNAAYTGSHVCTNFEILNTINAGYSADFPVNTTLWINNGPPGFKANANDCIGWTSSTAGDYGTVWIKTASGDGFGSLQECSTTARKYACCK